MFFEQLTPQIIPAITAQSLEDFVTQIGTLEGKAQVVQLDIADGTFSPSRTWAPESVEALPQAGSVHYEVHLMVRDPQAYMYLLKHPQVVRVVVHIESFSDHESLRAYIDEVHLSGKECGVAFLLKTDIAPHLSVLKAVDVVQLMSIKEVGHQGEPYDSCVEERIALVRSAYPGPIALDGGITEEIVPSLLAQGVTRFGVGSAILKAPQPVRALEAFQARLKE